MRWHEVLAAMGDELRADPTLVSFYGDFIRQRGIKDHRVPALDLWLVGDAEAEVEAPHIVQIDQWLRSFEQLLVSESIIRQMFNHEVPVQIQGVYMWSEFESGADLVDSPDRAGYYGRALRFSMIPLRAVYVNP